MPHRVVNLCNGLRLVHKETDSPISHFGVLVNAGTRDESPKQMGLAHFVEHTIFKGTAKRTPYRVINCMESVGGELNASTSKEETYFHTSFPSTEYPRAVELSRHFPGKRTGKGENRGVGGNQLLQGHAIRVDL